MASVPTLSLCKLIFPVINYFFNSLMIAYLDTQYMQQKQRYFTASRNRSMTTVGKC